MDLAREIYPDFNETRFKLVDKLRLTVIQYAAKNNTDLVFTMVYSPSVEDDAFVADIVQAVKSADGDVLFVELTAMREDLLSRVDNESRTKFHKLTNRDVLKEKLDKGDFQKAVKHKGVLSIDTSMHGPKEAAGLIAKHFNLPTIQTHPQHP
jgi:hypothetical protein